MHLDSHHSSRPGPANELRPLIHRHAGRLADVAYLGPAGTFTHAAAREWFGTDTRYLPSPTIDDVFDAVQRGEVACGVVPIENSTEGSVTRAVDALIEHDDIVIHREIVLDVDHCLLSRAAELSSIARVYSHPQALAQCRAWLATSLAGAPVVPTASTAAAALEAATDPTSAAIGSRLAAELYGLCVLRDNVQDAAGNATRFVLLAHEDAPRTGSDRTTLTFAVHNERGALKRVLEVFDDNDVNLTRIESRPSRQRAWDYVFLVDLDGHREDANLRASIAELAGRCPMLRVLGSYPRYDANEAREVR